MRALPLCALAVLVAAGCRFSGDEGGGAYACERDRIVYRLDHALASADHDHALDADHSAPLFIRFSNTGASSFWVSRVRLRHATYPPPGLTLGAREDRSSP